MSELAKHPIAKDQRINTFRAPRDFTQIRVEGYLEPYTKDCPINVGADLLAKRLATLLLPGAKELLWGDTTTFLEKLPAYKELLKEALTAMSVIGQRAYFGEAEALNALKAAVPKALGFFSIIGQDYRGTYTDWKAIKTDTMELAVSLQNALSSTASPKLPPPEEPGLSDLKIPKT
jgi:hypothetical protein